MLDHPLKNLIISVTLNPDKTVAKLVNLSYLPSIEKFELGLAKMTQKSEYRKAGVYEFRRETIKFPDYILYGIEGEAIVQYYHGTPSAAFMPWFATLEVV